MIRTVALAGLFIGIVAAEPIPNPPQLVDLGPNFVGVFVHSDGQTAWAAAENGLIYRSADGGVTWTGVDVPGSGEFNGVYFDSDGKRGWAVGAKRIASTLDGGMTWTASPWAPGDLYGVVFDSQGRRGFAVGWRNTILSTEDGGVSWRRVAEDVENMSDSGFSGISFDSTFKNGLIGGYGALLRTKDGGRTWSAEPGVFQHALSVWISPDGSYSKVMSIPMTNPGDKNEAFWFQTAPFGGSWTEIRSSNLKPPNAAVFHGRDAVVVGNDGIFFNSGSGTRLDRVFQGKFKSIAFASGTDVGLAVGEWGNVARTEDGGKTWRLIYRLQVGKCNRIAVQANSARVWGVGDKLFRSDEWGRNFKEQAVPGGPEMSGPLLNIKFSQDGRLGWITSKKGVILRTTDGGDHWGLAEMSHPDGSAINSVAFDPAARRGIAVGYERVWVTEDEGAHWKSTSEVSPARLNDVTLTNGGHTVWAVAGADEGETGKILRSDDFGESWKEVHNPAKTSLYRIDFSADGRLGWIAASDSTILRTVNRGRTWTTSDIFLYGQTAFDIEPTYFVDLWFDPTGQYGWAVGSVSNGRGFFRTVDAGRSWDLTAENSRWCCERIAFTPDGRRGWAFNGGSILAAVHQTEAPVIKKFEVTLPDYEVQLSAEDSDTPAENVRAVVDVEGESLDRKKARRVFMLPESDSVEWPEGTFRKGGVYTFHLRLTDGWNVATRDFVLGKASRTASPVNPLPEVSLEVPALQNLNVAGMSVLVDGQLVETAQIITRGGGGSISLTPSASVMRNLQNGFHVLTVTRGGTEVVKRVGFYKEQLTLKLVRPFGTSYALIVAIGDYPSGSGFNKLPSAVPQARQLEKTLRAQGFTVVPPLYDGGATKARIEAAIRTVPAGPDDRLLVYFGGHGDDEKGFQGKPVGYIIPYDGRKADLWGTAIPLEKFSGEYSARLHAKHVLFALDSCQSGLAVSRGGGLELSSDELKRFKALAEIEALSSESGRTILTAGTGGQDALDVSGGIFTAALTDAIRGKADADRNGVVDYFELFAYVWGRVNSEARQWIRKQQPADQQLGNGRWVFVYQ